MVHADRDQSLIAYCSLLILEASRQLACTFGPLVLLAQIGEIGLYVGDFSWCRLNLMTNYSSKKKFVNVLLYI